MKIALFAPYFPAPAFSGGRIRIQHFARALARRGEVHLFAQAHAREAGDARARAEAALYASVRVVHAGFTPPLFVNWGRAQRVRRGSPAQLSAAFARAHAHEPFDVIAVAHSHAAAAAFQSGVPWLLDEHNVESRYLAAKLQAGGGELRWWHQRELARMRGWERACWRAATEVVAVTEDDAKQISELRTTPAVHVPNGVDVSALAFTPPAARSGANILFVGLMDHPPNVQAAQLLAHEIMPRVWAGRPDARLVLCGANPARVVSALAGPRITVTGRVPTLAPHLAEARVFANCLVFGAGSSLKVLEALAAGVPLVSTRAGVRGFVLTPDEHFLPAETPAEFATEILRCLAAPASELQPRALAGRVFAESHSWQSLGERFAALTERAAGSPVSAAGVPQVARA